MNPFIRRRLLHLEALADKHEAAGDFSRVCELRQDIEGQLDAQADDASTWQAQNLFRLAHGYRALGKAKDAVRTYRDAIRCLERLDLDGDAPQPPPVASAPRISTDLAEILNSLGVLHCEMGSPRKALAPLRRALKLSSDPSDARVQHQAMVHGNLGSALHSLDEVDEAREHYLAAVNLFEQGPEKVELAQCLCDLVEVTLEEDVARARQFLAQALEVFRRTLAFSPGRLAHELIRVAGLASHCGDKFQAIRLLQEASQILSHQPGREEQVQVCRDLLGYLQAQES